MPLVVFNASEPYMLRRMLRPDPSDGDVFRIRLFSNDYTPVQDSVIGDFTQASYSGYAQQDLDPALWGDPIEVSGIARAAYDGGVFEFLSTSGTQDVYGYYVTDTSGGVALWGERFVGAPLTITPVNPVLILPMMTLHSEYEPV